MTDSFPNDPVGLLEATCHIHQSGLHSLRLVPPQLTVCLLKHIERPECITVFEDDVNWLVAFTGSAAAFEMRAELGLTDRVDVIEIAAGNTNYTNFYLDGELAVLQDRATRPQ